MDKQKSPFRQDIAKQIAGKTIEELRRDGVIVFRSPPNLLVMTLTKQECVELSQCIERSQRNGNWSPYIRGINQKLLDNLKEIGYYDAGHQKEPVKTGQQR